MSGRPWTSMVCGLGLLAATTAARAEDSKTPAQILSPTQALDKHLDDGAAALQSGIAETKGEGEFEITFADRAKQVEAKQQAAEAKTDLAAAVASARQAANLRAEAAKPGTDPAYAERLRGLALQAQESGSAWLSRAKSNLAAARGDAPKPGSEPSARRDSSAEGCNTYACRQLKMAAAAAGPGHTGEGLPAFEEPAPVGRSPSPVAPARDTLLKGALIPPPAIVPKPGGGEALAPAHGAAIDLGPLHDAVADVAPEMRGKPLFLDRGAVPSPDFLRVLADPEKNRALRNVGGVALEATFDLLAVSGVSDLRGGADIRLVDRPVLISLKALYAAAKPYAAPQGWARLPDAVRYPGNVVRLNGFVLDPKGGDVFLVGTTGDSDARLDIDEIILAVKRVWRDGKTMGVSLDPRPDSLGGPQYPRIIEAPPDSVAAKIMIEADYAMKAIMLDAGFARGKRLVDVSALMQAFTPEDMNDLSRFWLTPQRLGPGAIYVSASGDTTLLETRVQVRTESMVLRNGEIQGQGAASAIPERQAQLFARRYDAIERSPAVEPHGVFLRLHGLMDIVTFAKIWRARDIHNEALDAIAELPVRNLSGAEGVAAFYPGLSNVFNTNLGPVNAAGGVVMSLRQEANAAQSYDDHVARTLEQAAAAERGAPALAKAIDLTFAVPTAASSAGQDVDDKLLAASGALRRYDFERAAKAFRDVIAAAPADPQGYAGLAFSLLELDSPREAAPYALRAVELAPSDEGYQMLARDVVWRMDARAAYAGFAESDRRELSRYYAHWAALAAHDGQGTVRDRDAGWAADLWEDNGDAHIIQALALDAESPGREQQMARSVRAFRRQLQSGAPEARQPLAMALLMSSSQHTLRATSRLTPGADAKPILDLLNRGVDEARQSLEIAPDLPAAAASGVLAEGLIWLVSTPGDKAAAAAILERSRALISRYPKDAGVRIAHAQLLVLTGDPNAGLREADEAVRFAPSDVTVRITRAGLLAAQGDCAGAAAEFAQARSFAGKYLAIVAEAQRAMPPCAAH